LAKKSVKKVEALVLSKVPGYELLKGMSESLVGLEDASAYPVVILTLDDVGQIALLIEEGDDGLVTVFVPDSPSPRSGGVFFVKREVITRVDVPLPVAMKCLKNFGGGSAELRRLAVGPLAPDSEQAAEGEASDWSGATGTYWFTFMMDVRFSSPPPGWTSKIRIEMETTVSKMGLPSKPCTWPSTSPAS
jgi:hypothetical protein